MILIALILALPLCAAATLASYVTMLYIEQLRLRPRANALSFNSFDERLAAKLKLDPGEGVERYSMVRQLSLVLLTVDLVVLTGAGGGPGGGALIEVAVLAAAATILFAHILPSILVIRTRGAWALPWAPALRLCAWAAQPFTLLSGFARSVAELGEEAVEEKRSNHVGEDIEALLDAGQEEGLIGEEDRKLIQSVVEFGDKTVREAMTARPQIVAIEAERSVEDLRRLLIEEGYSRVPIYEGSVDSMIGFVHSRDMLGIDEQARGAMSVRELARPIALVPETKEIRLLLREMQEANQQMAIVVDEYGQTAGLATMEDLMEEIVGEIRDESEPGRDVALYPDGSFVSSGNLDLDRLEELVDFRPDDDVESTTVGGLVCEHLGEVPSPGAKLRLDGVEIEVLSADERRVRSVHVRRLETAAPEGSDGGEAGGADGAERKGAA